MTARHASSLALLMLSALTGCAGAGGAGSTRTGPGNGGPAPSRSGGLDGVAGLPGPLAQRAELARLSALGKPIFCAPRRGNLVALTFDDGPGPYTALALRKLRVHGARATFFLVGKELTRGVGLPARERALGAVGDHTWTHPVLPALSAATVHDELARTQQALASASGAPVELFRPPYGARTPAIDAQARALGMVQVIWDVDSRDSAGANYAGIAENVKRGLVPGSIILMHENRGQTIRALIAILDELRRRHLRAVSVPELLAADPPSPDQVGRGAQACSLIASGPGG